ncbi:putative glycerate dehydrogenase [Helianthus annuus]|nr:putative glycerate dehydrogenase [Helianthus annuus]
MRAGLYDGWLPYLFMGNLLKRQTVGVIGAGCIGFPYSIWYVFVAHYP